MVIYPDITVTPDCPTIKFHQPHEQVDLDKELPRILHAQGWGVGTYFHVQFMNHEKTKLLSCGRFVVTEELETIQTNDANPYQPMTKTVFSRRAEQIGEWWPQQDKEETSVNISPGALPIPSASEIFTEPKRRGRPPKAATA